MHKISRLLIFAFILIQTFAVSDARIWTDNKGRKLDAELISVDGQNIVIVTKKGTRATVRISTLSAADQDFIRSQSNSDDLDPFAEPEPEPDQELEQEQEPEPATAEETDDVKTVVVEGMGETIAEAKKDALRNAVHEVVGSLVDAQTRVNNDEVIEQILTASGAYVETHKVIRTTKADGLFTVTVRASVVKTAIIKKLDGGGKKVTTLQIDGASLLGKAESKTESEKNGAIFLANFLKQEEFPYSLIDVQFNGNPKIAQRGEEIDYTCYWSYSVNMEKYYAFVKRLTPILEKLAIRKSSFTMDFEKDEDGEITYNTSSIPKYNGSNMPFCVCTMIMGNFKSSRWDCYEMPKKNAIVLWLYACVIPSVEVNLVGNGDALVASKRTMIQKTHEKEFWDVFNILNSIRSSFERKEVTSTGESTITMIEERWHDNPVLFALFPFMRGYNDCAYLKDCKLRISPSAYYTTVFTLNKEELAQVRSATAHVLTNNPAMDKAYEALPQALDKIATE